LIEHRLYGIRVQCQRALYTEPEDKGAGAPGDHPVVELAPLALGIHPGLLTERANLYSSHNRQVYLCTDRPLADSAPGQPWCLEVEGVVTFHWRGRESVVQYQESEQGDWRLIAFWFVHIFLPMYLALERNYDFIHCAGVECLLPLPWGGKAPWQIIFSRGAMPC
jgi:hypothetical protein